MLEFADETVPLDAEWTDWARDHPGHPVYLAALDISDEGPRFVGAFVTPAHVALGLPAWDDADEGAEPAPWALFDVEKLVRMALHQSGLAFEALTSPHCWSKDFPARQIAGAAVTAGLLDYYRDVTAPLEEANSERWRWRTLLTGVRLARDGVVCQDFDSLISALAVPTEPQPELAKKLRSELASSSLPSKPTDYDYLSEFVVACRQDAT